jgi:two-component system sensor histidine kinase GlrK
MPEAFVIEFADTGPGIPEDEQPKIFEAFFQGRREQGGPVGGTGIGLSVVNECIQAHEGAVELLDVGEFSGAHFRIVIPQQKMPQAVKLAANA